MTAIVLTAAVVVAALVMVRKPNTAEPRNSGIPAYISTSLANEMLLTPLPHPRAPAFTLTDQRQWPAVGQDGSVGRIPGGGPEGAVFQALEGRGRFPLLGRLGGDRGGEQGGERDGSAQFHGGSARLATLQITQPF